MSTVHSPTDTRVFQKECKSLEKAGYEVHLVIQGKDEVVDGVVLHGLRHPKNRVDRMSFLVEEALRHALEVDAELYHLHDPELLRIALRLKDAGKHVVFDSHEFYRYQIAEKQYLPKRIAEVASRVYAAYEAKVCRQIDAVIVPCTRQGYNPFEGRARRVIYIDNYPILHDLKCESQGRSTFSNAICYVGGLTYNRGITHLIKAAYTAGVTAILAGPIDNAYLTKLKSLPEYQCVDYRGFVDREGVDRIISESFCGAAALLNVGQYWLGDNLPTKAYEYMAGGIPFLMSPTHYAQKFAKEYPCCLLVDPEDVVAYSDAIRMLRENPEMARKMSKIGYLALINEFNWQREANKLIGLYEEILD